MKKKDFEKILVQLRKYFEQWSKQQTVGTIIRSMEKESMTFFEIDPECYRNSIHQILVFYRIKLLADSNIIDAREEKKLSTLYQKYLDSYWLSHPKEKQYDEMLQTELILNQYHLLDKVDIVELIKNDFCRKFEDNQKGLQKK